MKNVKDMAPVYKSIFKTLDDINKLTNSIEEKVDKLLAKAKEAKLAEKELENGSN